MDEPKLLGLKKPPYAPIAPANPSAAAASLPLSAPARLNATGTRPASRSRCQFEKPSGIVQNANTLPIPDLANRTRNANTKTKKLGKKKAAVCADCPGNPRRGGRLFTAIGLGRAQCGRAEARRAIQMPVRESDGNHAK